MMFLLHLSFLFPVPKTRKGFPLRTAGIICLYVFVSLPFHCDKYAAWIICYSAHCMQILPQQSLPCLRARSTWIRDWILFSMKSTRFLRPFFLTSIKLAMNTYLSPCFESIHLRVFYNLSLNINNKRSIPLSVYIWNYSLFIWSFLVPLLGLLMFRQSRMLW